MTNEKWITAEELMAELERDPNYQRRKAERERRQFEREAKDDAIVRPIINNLNALGLEGASLNEIVKNESPLPEPAVDVLLSWIPQIEEPRVLETLVRSLAAANHSFDGSVLVQCFHRKNDWGLRWAIMNTISVVHPHSIDAWLAEISRDPDWGGVLRKLNGD